MRPTYSWWGFAGDYDNDGHLDLYITSYQDELTALYCNIGDGFFEDVTKKTGAGAGSTPHVTWDTGLVDFDNARKSTNGIRKDLKRFRNAVSATSFYETAITEAMKRLGHPYLND